MTCYICLEPCDTTSPCPCATPVHITCLDTYVTTQHNVTCSICKGRLARPIPTIIRRTSPQHRPRRVSWTPRTKCALGMCCMWFLMSALCLCIGDQTSLYVMVFMTVLMIISLSVLLLFMMLQCALLYILPPR